MITICRTSGETFARFGARSILAGRKKFIAATRRWTAPTAQRSAGIVFMGASLDSQNGHEREHDYADEGRMEERVRGARGEHGHENPAADPVAESDILARRAAPDED